MEFFLALAGRMGLASGVRKRILDCLTTDTTLMRNSRIAIIIIVITRIGGACCRLADELIFEPTWEEGQEFGCTYGGGRALEETKLKLEQESEHDAEIITAITFQEKSTAYMAWQYF